MAVGQEIASIIGGNDHGCYHEINVICLECRSGYCGKRAAIALILNKDDDWMFPGRACPVGEVDQHCAKNGRDVRSTRETIRRSKRGSTNTQNALAPSPPDHPR